AAVNLLLNALLIPPLGAEGAALAAILSILLGLTVRWRFVSRAVLRLRWGRLLAAPLAASLLALGLALVPLGRVPWPVVALACTAAYVAMAVAGFPFVRRALQSAWARR